MSWRPRNELEEISSIYSSSVATWKNIRSSRILFRSDRGNKGEMSGKFSYWHSLRPGECWPRPVPSFNLKNNPFNSSSNKPQILVRFLLVFAEVHGGILLHHHYQVYWWMNYGSDSGIMASLKAPPFFWVITICIEKRTDLLHSCQKPY